MKDDHKSCIINLLIKLIYNVLIIDLIELVLLLRMVISIGSLVMRLKVLDQKKLKKLRLEVNWIWTLKLKKLKLKLKLY